MQKLTVFNHVTSDGYFVDKNGSMAWARTENRDPEWNRFVVDNASGNATLIFGRITYELMANFWPTSMAAEHDPVVAQRMNQLHKVVFSRTLKEASWNNTSLIKDDMAGTVRKMKAEEGEGLVILGSGTIVSQLAQEHLIDDYQLVVNPVVVGGGRTMFEGLTEKLLLKLAKSRTFSNGYVFLSYEPAV